MFNEGNQIRNFISSSGSGTLINYGSGPGSAFLTSYGSGSDSTSQKVTVPTVPVPVPVPQRWFKVQPKKQSFIVKTLFMVANSKAALSYIYDYCLSIYSPYVE
jgi:hypothetical protein